MIDFIIKSTISLGFLYLFYILILSRIKTFEFNRYFLVGSVVFSIVIPFITIPVDNTVVPIQDALEVLLISDSIEQTGVVVNVAQEESLITTNILLFLYLAVIGVLLIRFGLNLSNIIKQIRGNQKVKQTGFTLILVKEKVLPHTFLNYVLVNDDEYRNGRIDDAMIQHEVAHCSQWHSLDIVFIELLKIILWINPFIWLIKKSIQLNHEYQADCSVLTSHNINKYQQTLINTVLNNNTGELVSNFNFSFIKQRLKMMKRQLSPRKAAITKIAAICTILIVGITISCNQDPLDELVVLDESNEWWQPILKKHNIEPVAYNNFPYVFEMGSKNAINDRVVNLENALFLFRPVRKEDKQPSKHSFVMVKAPIAEHDLESDSIKAVNGELKMFSFKDGKISSSNLLKFSELKMYVSDRKFWFRVDKGTNHKISVDGDIAENGEYYDNIVVRY